MTAKGKFVRTEAAAGGREADELRALIREAHEAAQGLSTAAKAAALAQQNLETRVMAIVGGQIQDLVDEQMDRFSEAMAAGLAASEKAIFERFTKLENILFGRRHRSQPTLDEMVEIHARLTGYIHDLRGGIPPEVTFGAGGLGE
jgi:hypothetical protein